MKIRYFICIFILIFSLTSINGDVTGIRIETLKNIAACKNENNATRKDYDEVRDTRVPETQEGKCFMACMFEKCKVMEAGKYSRESFTKGIKKLYSDNPQKQKKALEMVEDCSRRSGQWNGIADKCAYAAKVMECFISYQASVPVVKDFLKYQK